MAWWSGKTKLDRFMTFVNRTDTCWLWTGGHDNEGYGQFNYGGKTVRAHRVSYELHNGTIDKNLDVLHTCDVRGCVNPDHLYQGTHQQNMQDRNARGRMAKGESHARHKLTYEQVEYIRSCGERTSSLARKFGVEQCTISNIRKGRIWKEI